MTRKLLAFVMLAALVAVVALAIACGDDDEDDGSAADDGGDATPDAATAAEVEDIVGQLLDTDPASDADLDFFFEHATAEAVSYFGYSSAEECRANAEDCIGDPTVASSFSDTQVSGDEASTIATADSGDVIYVALIREDDTWKMDGFAFTAEIPAGVPTIDISAVDYGYEWDPGELAPGDVAFALTNNGDELHEAAVVAVSEDFNIDDVLASSPESQDELPPGVEAFAGFGFATPGRTSNIVFGQPLEPGNYALLCFIPDADGTPHIALGMHSEFTIE